MADEDKTDQGPGPIDMRADRWRRPWILAAWPATALAAAELLNSDNPWIQTADGLVTFKTMNGEAIYKIEGEPKDGVLTLALQDGSTFEAPPEPGSEPEPPPEPKPDDQGANNDGHVQGGAPPAAAGSEGGAQQSPAPPPEHEPPQPTREDTTYFGPEPGETVLHGEIRRKVLNTQHRAGEGSFVQFHGDDAWVSVDELRPAPHQEEGEAQA